MKLNIVLAVFVLLVFGAEVYHQAHTPPQAENCVVSK